MLPIVFNSANAFLLNDDPHWATPFEAEFSMFRDDQLGLTHREARRPYSDTLLTTARYDAIVLRRNLRQLQGSLRAITTEPVIMPLWPAVGLWQNRAAALIKGGLMVAWKSGWTQYEVYPAGSEPGWPTPNDFVAPSLMGFLKPNKGPVLYGEAFTFPIEFVESSPSNFALITPNSALLPGPQPAGYPSAPPLLPFRPDRDGLQEQIAVSIKREQVGFSRDQFATFYPHFPELAQEARYSLQNDDVWNFLSFFQAVIGPGVSFWAPSALQEVVLSQDALAADSVLHVESTEAAEDGDYLLIFPNGAAPIFRQVTAPPAPDALTLNAAVGLDFHALTTPIYRLCLARADKPLVKFTWQKPGFATADLTWIELPEEYAISPNETLGVTQGTGLARLILFQFDRDLGNGTIVTTRYTSFGKDVNSGGHAWPSANITHGDINQSLNLENDSTEIKCFIEPGNPVVDDLKLQSEAPLSVTIYHADWDGVAVSNVQQVFSGNAAAPSREGNAITLKCQFGKSIFDTSVPRYVKGTICNHIGGSNNDGSFLISAGCTLLKADWLCTATIANPISNAYPYVLHLATFVAVGAGVSATTVFDNFFRNGWIEIGAGQNIKRRLIIASTAPVAGALTLTLHRYLPALPAFGDAITFFPGCDGLYSTCKAYDAALNPTGQFSNDLNFGAQPFTPVANRSMVALPNQNITGAKK